MPYRSRPISDLNRKVSWSYGIRSPLRSGLVGARFCCRDAAPVAFGRGGHETKTSSAHGGAAGKEAREMSGATACPGHEEGMVGGMA